MIPSGTCDPPYADGCHCASALRLSRRRILTRAAAAIVTGAVLDVVALHPARAASPLTPDQALQHLIDGNRRFVEGRMTAFDEDLAILKQKTASKQEPFAAVLCCAESRAPAELIVGQSIGHLFVTRVAGK